MLKSFDFDKIRVGEWVSQGDLDHDIRTWHMPTVGKDLDRNADIDRHTPIGMEGVSGVSLYTHLDLLLLAVGADSPTKLGYVINNGIIIVATPTRAAKL